MGRIVGREGYGRGVKGLDLANTRSTEEGKLAAVLIHDENRYSTDEEFEAFLKAKCEEHSKPFLHSVEGLSINSTTWTPKACCN